MLPLPICQCSTPLFVLSTRRLRPRTNVMKLCAKLFVGSHERRASPKVTHFVSTIMTKKLGQAFQGLRKSRGQSPLVALRRERNPLSPKISSARGSKMPAGILCRGRIARASPMGKGRSIRPFPIKTSELVTTGLRCQVKIRGPARRCRSLTSYPHRLSGGQSCGGITFVAMPAFLWSRWSVASRRQNKKSKNSIHS